MRKYKDLTGEKFGRLTAKYRTEDKISKNNKRRIQWVCDCDCGEKDIIVLADSLTKGNTKSCGCLRREADEHRYLNILGMKFNRLTVVAKANNYISPNGTPHAQWWCECDCGNPELVLTSTANLTSGITNSCGCYRLEQLKKACCKENTYTLDNEYGIGYCSNTNKNGTHEFYFDLEDYDKIKDFHWFFDDDGYVIGYVNGTKQDVFTRMHRLVLGLDNYDLYPDHIKHVNHDNRKSQLRLGTATHNGRNKSLKSDNTSGTTGVYYDKDRYKWAAQIVVDKKLIHLGRYIKKEDAIKARKEAENMYFGEWSYDNSMKL